MINKIVQVTVSNSAVGNLKYYRVDCRYEMNGKRRKDKEVWESLWKWGGGKLWRQIIIDDDTDNMTVRVFSFSLTIFLTLFLISSITSTSFLLSITSTSFLLSIISITASWIEEWSSSHACHRWHALHWGFNRWWKHLK